MEIYVKKYLFFSIFFFWFSTRILSDALILPVSQLQTQRMMTSQIRSHIEHLIQTYYILCSFCSQNWWKIYPQWRVQIRFNDSSWQWLTFLGHPVCAANYCNADFQSWWKWDC